MRLSVLLASIITTAVLAIAVTAGFFWGSHSTSSTSLQQPSAIDIGFARDMSNHHDQAVTMATYVADNSSDPSVRALAFDIESGQTTEIGEMTGWLETWGLQRGSTAKPMVWMGAAHASHVINGLMPGMATPTQLAQLLSMHGKPLDLFFLQLMLRHHQGGLPMAQYAAQNAAESYVRKVAQRMASVQSAEIIEIEQLLRQLGGTPLPAPVS